jgi:hypothetical protein
MKTRLVALLMRLYPTAWRNEYGAELTSMLQGRPLTTRVVSDVVLSAMWQRMRAVDLATWVGLGLMFVTIGAIASNIVAPPPHIWSPGLPRGAQPRFAEYIALLQRPLHSEFYVLVLAGIGFWAALRGKTSPGCAAIRVSMIASCPLVLVGLLMMSGGLGYSELGPGQASTTFDERGILYTFYKGFQQIPGPAPLVMLLSPLLRLPGAWMWGSIGGWLGRQCAGWWRRPVRA